MARNTHPEETRARILNTAELLFASQGYANTSVQDIVDALGNLSKGAIYHHFDSKLDILLALNERDLATTESHFAALLNRTDLNGLQKIQESIRAEITDTHHAKQIKALAPVLSDPENFLINVKNWATTVPNELYLPLIREGIEDSSITTEYPEEAAQLLSMLLNLWFLPPIFNGTRAQLKRRLECFAVMLEAIGLPIFTVGLLNNMTDFLYGIIATDDSTRGENDLKAITSDMHQMPNNATGTNDTTGESEIAKREASDPSQTHQANKPTANQ